MITVVAFGLLATATKAPLVQITDGVNSSGAHPVFVDTAKRPNGLTLYNEKGEVVARCKKQDERFAGCKMEPGMTLDDLMNAWVRAYMDVQK